MKSENACFQSDDERVIGALGPTSLYGQTGEGWIYLLVQPSGTGSCIQRLVVRGRRRELGLGSIPFVSFAEARETAVANRKVAREGVDPLADKRHVRAMPTVAEAADSVLEQKRPGWRSSKHGQQWRSTVSASPSRTSAGCPCAR